MLLTDQLLNLFTESSKLRIFSKFSLYRYLCYSILIEVVDAEVDCSYFVFTIEAGGRHSSFPSFSTIISPSFTMSRPVSSILGSVDITKTEVLTTGMVEERYCRKSATDLCTLRSRNAIYC